MDIFAHGLWAGAAYKTINKKSKRQFSVKLAAFWGMFPDIFAFTIGFVWFFWNLVFGGLFFTDLPHPAEIEPAQKDTLIIFRLISLFYNISHSAIIFIVVFLLVWLVRNRFIPHRTKGSEAGPVWELGGWLLHIILDIPTHSYKFYPTPFLWPLFSWKFDGFSWLTPWFLILNYSAIIMVYLFLHHRKKFNPIQKTSSSLVSSI